LLRFVRDTPDSFVGRGTVARDHRICGARNLSNDRFRPGQHCP
jgi:hypothetical protein